MKINLASTLKKSNKEINFRVSVKEIVPRTFPTENLALSVSQLLGNNGNNTFT